MGLEPDHLHPATVSPTEDPKFSQWRTFLVQLSREMVLADVAPPPAPMHAAFEAAMQQCEVTGARITAWEGGGCPLAGGRHDELEHIMFGSEREERAALLASHLTAVDTLLEATYGEAYTRRDPAWCDQCPQTMFRAVKARTDMPILHVAMVLFALSRELGVHNWFCGRSQDGTETEPRVDVARYAAFSALLNAATDKLVKSTLPFVNPQIYASLCAWYFATTNVSGGGGVP